MLNSVSTQATHVQEAKMVAPDLSTKIKYKSIIVSDLKFENQTNEATVSAGANVYGRLIINIQPQGKFNVLRQVIIGIKEIGAQILLYSECKIIGKRFEGFLGVDQNNKVYEPYSDYPKEFQIKAPNKPGLYELEVCLLELEADPVPNPGSINGFFQAKPKDQKIFETENPQDFFWDLESQNCMISMGKIRVL